MTGLSPPQRLALLALAFFGMGCAEDAKDPIDTCAPTASPTLALGTWTDDVFVAYEPLEVHELVVAPQGGLGIEVDARSTGLGQGPFTVLLDTEVDGENAGSHENEVVASFCQDDGSGRFTTQVIGFHAQQYKRAEDIEGLQGRTVMLLWAATDDEGHTAQARLEVLVAVPE